MPNDRHFPVQDVLVQLTDILRRRLRYLQIAPEAYKSAGSFLVEQAVSTRWYTMTTQAEIERLWADVRRNEPVLDLVMAATIELRTLLHDWEIDFDRLSQMIANDVVSLSPDSEASRSVIDEELHERMSNADSHLLYRDNPWLVVLYLASQTDMELVVGSDFFEAPSGAPGRE